VLARRRAAPAGAVYVVEEGAGARDALVEGEQERGEGHQQQHSAYPPPQRRPVHPGQNLQAAGQARCESGVGLGDRQQDQEDGEQHQDRQAPDHQPVHRGGSVQAVGQALLADGDLPAEDDQGAEQQRQGQHHQDPGEPARSAVHAASLGHGEAALGEHRDAARRQGGGEGRQCQQEEQPAAPGGTGAPGGDTHEGARRHDPDRAAGAADVPTTRKPTPLRSHPTDPNKTQHLSAAQLAAVELVVLGKPDGEVAAAGGVTRPTVWGWRHYHPGFMVALNARRRELFGQAGDRLRALLGKALDVLEAELAPEDSWSEPRLKTALKILEYAGAGGLVAQVAQPGPEDPEAILAAAARAGGDDLLSWLASSTNGPAVDALRAE
jgi:hypothetical protein